MSGNHPSSLFSSVPATVLPERLGVYTHNSTASLLAPSPTLTLYRKAMCHFYWRGLLATAAKGLVLSPSLQISRAAWINPWCLGHHAGRISGVRWAAVRPMADISRVMWQKQRWPRAAVCRGGSNTTRCFSSFCFANNPERKEERLEYLSLAWQWPISLPPTGSFLAVKWLDHNPYEGNKHFFLNSVKTHAFL